MKAPLYNQDGKQNGTIDLPKEIFEVTVNEGLIHEALVRHQSNNRNNIAKTKTKAEVKGGGRKPWKQKGTGRARQGSIRSPQWRGGGVVFGPTGEENYTKNMPKKMRRKALFGALSQKAKDDQIIVLEKFELDAPKTKTLLELINNLPIDRNVLLVIAKKNIIIEKSSSNLENVKTLLVNFLNVHDVLKYDKVLFLKDSVSAAQEIFTSEKK